LTQPPTGALPFVVTPAGREEAKQRPVYFVVTNIEIDVRPLELPALARLVTIADLARRASRGPEAFVEPD
jgi:hypothetical protein